MFGQGFGNVFNEGYVLPAADAPASKLTLKSAPQQITCSHMWLHMEAQHADHQPQRRQGWVFQPRR